MYYSQKNKSQRTMYIYIYIYTHTYMCTYIYIYSICYSITLGPHRKEDRIISEHSKSRIGQLTAQENQVKRYIGIVFCVLLFDSTSLPYKF